MKKFFDFFFLQNDTSLPIDGISGNIGWSISTRPVELRNKLLFESMRKIGTEEMIGNGSEIEIENKIGSEKYNLMNLTSSLKPIISGLIVELKKQFAVKKPAISLHGAIQRATGDFWVAFANTINTIGNFLDILFSPILALLQPPPDQTANFDD